MRPRDEVSVRAEEGATRKSTEMMEGDRIVFSCGNGGVGNPVRVTRCALISVYEVYDIGFVRRIG